MATKKDLLLLLLDVGEHMQPYLPIMHRMAFDALNCKLISKPNHEVAVVLYGTKATRHALYDPDDPAASYPHVTVLRPLQNVAAYTELQRFTFASDSPAGDHDGDEEDVAEGTDAAAAAAALLARIEAAGLAGGGAAGDAGAAAAAASRAVRLFGPPGPRADWCDGLVVGLDLLVTALNERFGAGQMEARKLGGVRVALVSNLLAESVPYDDDMRDQMVNVFTERNILLDVFCLDHYAPPPAAADTLAGNNGNNGYNGGNNLGGGGGEGGVYDTLSRLPPELAAARRRNLDALHEFKAGLAPAAFRHLRHPAELLCLFRSKEVAMQASNAVLRLTPGPAEGEDPGTAPPAITLGVKLYKKIRRAAVEEWKSVLDTTAATGAAAAAAGEGERAGAAAAGGTSAEGGAEGDADTAGPIDPGFIREVEYEDPTDGSKFSREDPIAKGYSYGKQAVPVARYYDGQGGVGGDEELQKLRETDFSLLGFVDAESVPRHMLIDEPYVVLGDSPSSAVAIAALALTLDRAGQAGLVRFVIRKEFPRLGALTPHLSTSADVPHALLLSPLPFAEDLRTHAFSTFRNEAEAAEVRRLLAEARGEQPPEPVYEQQQQGGLQGLGSEGRAPSSASGSGGGLLAGLLESSGSLGSLQQQQQQQARPLRYEKMQPSGEQQEAALELVRCMDLGPGAGLTGGGFGGGGVGEVRPEVLVPEATANPQLRRAYELVTSRALDPTAQLPHPDDDPLVGLVLRPLPGRWPPGALRALQGAEAQLQCRERFRGEGPAAKRPRLEGAVAAADGEEAAGVEGAGGPSAGAAVAAADGNQQEQQQLLFDPSAAGGTSARVSRVGELTAEEDFRAMMAQGRESAVDAVRQMQELVRVLVDKSIGAQLYDKALKCVQALRGGCLASGRAGAFNSFLQDLATWCIRRDRGAFLTLLTAQRISLITTEDMAPYRPASGTAAAAAEAAAAAGGPGPGPSLFEDDGGAVEPSEAQRYLDQHAGAAAVVEEATLQAVVHDEEFEDMD